MYRPHPVVVIVGGGGWLVFHFLYSLPIQRTCVLGSGYNGSLQRAMDSEGLEMVPEFGAVVSRARDNLCFLSFLTGLLSLSPGYGISC